MSRLIKVTEVAILCLATLGLLVSSSSNAQQKLAFAVNFPGAPPYLYLNEKSQTYQGLVVDFFATMRDPEAIEVEYLEMSRARSEQFVYAGKADLFLSSLAWVKHPDKVISTDPLNQNESFLYSIRPFPVDFSLRGLATEHICTRYSYVYPALEPLFRKGVSRVDSSSQTSMLLMMLGERCDFSVINKYNAVSIMNAPPFCDKTFYHSPTPISSVPNAFVLHKSRTKLVAKINAYLAKFKHSGEFNTSLSKHTMQLLGGCDAG